MQFNENNNKIKILIIIVLAITMIIAAMTNNKNSIINKIDDIEKVKK